jgi:hypothetical protein
MAITRTTVYLDPRIYRATKVKSALVGKPLSTLVNEALILALREDEADLAAVRHRRKEPSRPFEDVLSDLKRDGLL